MSPQRQWLLRILGVLVVLIVGDFAAERLRVSYWSPIDENQMLRVFTYLHDGPAADVVILGSSRVRAALIPAEIEDTLAPTLDRHLTAYSLAQNGADAYTCWRILDDAVSVHGVPDAVILELSPAALNAHNTNVARDFEHYSSFFDLLGSIRWITTADRLTGAAAGCFRGVSSLALYGLRFVYEDSVASSLATYRRLKGGEFPQQLVNEYRPPPAPNAVRRLAQLDTAVRLTRRLYMIDYTIGGAPAAGFTAMVDLAAEHDIPLILVDPPVTPEYGESIVTPDELADYRRVVERAVSRPGSTVVEADLSGLDIADEDFQDLTHLNPIGARKLSHFLAETVLVPVLAD